MTSSTCMLPVLHDFFAFVFGLIRTKEKSGRNGDQDEPDGTGFHTTCTRAVAGFAVATM